MSRFSTIYALTTNRKGGIHYLSGNLVILIIRKKISIAKAEVERLKENRKITKQGRKNRVTLQEECNIAIAIAGLANYMEKKQSLFRMLKKGFHRKKKQEESRTINSQFKMAPEGCLCEYG